RSALDPEPIAVEIDTLVHDLFAMVPTLTTELLPDLPVDKGLQVGQQLGGEDRHAGARPVRDGADPHHRAAARPAGLCRPAEGAAQSLQSGLAGAEVSRR